MMPAAEGRSRAISRKTARAKPSRHRALLSQGQTHILSSHQLLHRVFDQIRTPIIGEAGGKLAEDSDALFDLLKE